MESISTRQENFGGLDFSGVALALLGTLLRRWAENVTFGKIATRRRGEQNNKQAWRNEECIRSFVLSSLLLFILLLFSLIKKKNQNHVLSLTDLFLSLSLSPPPSLRYCDALRMPPKRGTMNDY